MSSTVQNGVKENFSDKIRRLQTMKSMVDDAQNILIKGNHLSDFGKMLHETWKLKKSLSSIISNSDIDDMYQSAIKAGAEGGKLLGSGGGGFLLFYVDKDKQKYVREALKNLLYIPFNFENDGTRIIYYDE